MKLSHISIILLILILGGALGHCKGSEHSVQVMVRDSETGSPIEGATTLFRFTRVHPPGKGWGFAPPSDVKRRTNNRGQAHASGSVPVEAGEIWINVEAEGYYGGGDSLQVYDSKGQKIAFDERVIELRAKRNAQAMYARRFSEDSLLIPAVGEDLGLDLMRSDWLPPHGEGEHADVIFHMVIGEKHGETFAMDYGQTGMLMDVEITMSFPEGGGIIALSAEDLPASAFKWPYTAPGEGYEAQHLLLAKRLNKDNYNDAEYSWNRDKGLRYIFRTRPVSAQNGDVMQFHYGRIHEPPRLQFVNWQGNPSEIGLVFSYTFNPIPGERSMEFDVSRNLFEGTGLVPSQYLGGFQP